MFSIGVLSALGLTLCHDALAATAAEWRNRSIYQVMTDRFARTDGSTTTACDTSTNGGVYCGGTWQGLINNLDYIQGMGFDAVWISPVTKQLEGNTVDGSAYHGYWQTDIYSVNENFGTAVDLQNLAAALHSRSMYLMVDIVVNHFAYYGSPSSIDYSTFVPFNSADDFHSYCTIDYNNIANITQIEQCWMGDTTVPLPDLKTEVSSVSSVWNTWVGELVSNYSIDGLRIDSFMQVNTGFWSSFLSVAGVYALGEVYEADASLVCSYQNYAPGVFNYGMYFPLIAAFSSASGSIGTLANTLDTIKASCPDTSLLGTFSENHDQPRFASLTADLSLAENVLTFTLLTDGIPVVYQGQEQHYSATGGSSTPYNREALWLSAFNTAAPLYSLLTRLNAIRRAAAADDATFLTYQTWTLYSDYTNLALRKGNLVTVLSNVGATGADYSLTISTGFTAVTPMTEVLTCGSTLSTASDGSLVVPMSGGLPTVYYPTAGLGGLCGGSSGRKLVRSRLFRL